MPRQIARRPQERGIFSYQPTRDHDAVAARQSVSFAYPRGHTFMVTFAGKADLPASWECRQHGVEGQRKGISHNQPVTQRTHLDMLRERRTEPELAQLLAEQIKELRAGRLVGVEGWLLQMQAMRKD